MTIQKSDRACPECESTLRAIYQTTLQQVPAGYSCPACGYVESVKRGFSATVPRPEETEYVLRTERPLTSDDVRHPLTSVEDEFRALASAEMGPDEVWTLVDPDAGEVVDVVRGRTVREGRTEEPSAEDEG